MKELYVERLGRGFAWFDIATPESPNDASAFVHALEKRQGYRIGCLQEIAFLMGFISRDDLIALGRELAKSAFDRYLLRIAEDPEA